MTPISPSENQSLAEHTPKTILVAKRLSVSTPGFGLRGRCKGPPISSNIQTVVPAGQRVLLVEDQTIIALATSGRVTTYGYDVSVAHTGEEAVELVRSALEKRTPFSLILMDIDLGPGIDGVETSRRILEHQDVPIVFLTAHTEPDYVKRVREVTRYGYVLKSSNDLILRLSMEMAIDLFETTRRAQEQEREIEAIYDHAPISMVVVDSHNRIIKGNRRARRAFAQLESRGDAASLGAVVRCLHAAIDPTACLRWPECGACDLRRLVDETLEHGVEHSEVVVSVAVDAEGSSGHGRHKRISVSTSPVTVNGRRLALVCIPDLDTRPSDGDDTIHG